MYPFLFTTAYISGLAWFGGEFLLLSANGSPIWFIAFFLFFIVGFVVIGCANISNAAINKAAAIFSAFVALALVVFTLLTVQATWSMWPPYLNRSGADGVSLVGAKLLHFFAHSWVAIAKLGGAAIFALLTLETFRWLSADKSESHGHSHGDEAHA